MKKLFYISLIVLLAGCSGHTAPCVQDLFAINCSHYVLGSNDCCDKAVEYCNSVNSSGGDCHVVVGYTKDYDVPHAWTEILSGGEIFWCDPTWDMRYAKKELWRDRTVSFTYDKSATAEDVRHYNYSKIINNE